MAKTPEAPAGDPPGCFIREEGVGPCQVEGCGTVILSVLDPEPKRSGPSTGHAEVNPKKIVCYLAWSIVHGE